MIDFIYSKIENLEYRNHEDLEELNKIIGAAIFSVVKESNIISPIQDPFVLAIEELKMVKLNQSETSGNKEIFTIARNEALRILGKLDIYLVEHNLKDVSLINMMKSDKRRKFDKELEFALLMIEQKHIAYFREQPPKFKNEEHDRLHFHYFTTEMRGEITFGFVDHTILPNYIITETTNTVKETVKNYL